MNIPSDLLFFLLSPTLIDISLELHTLFYTSLTLMNNHTSHAKASVIAGIDVSANHIYVC